MTREEIIARRKACDLNELAAIMDHAATMHRIQTSLQYVQAECEHPPEAIRIHITVLDPTVLSFRLCLDCGKRL